MRRRTVKRRGFRTAMALIAALWASVLMMALVSVAAQTSLLDSRIKAADIICYSDRFGSFGIDRGNICGSQTFFDLYQLCDVPDLHGLIAPRPLLVEIGTYDECFLVKDALSCAREVEKIYAAAEASENFEIELFEGGHQFAGNKAFDFFDRHLK